MSPHHREQKAIAAVACPTCGAPRGAVCRGRATHGRLTICSERRRAWQAWRATQGDPDYIVQAPTRAQADRYVNLLCPQSRAAVEHLRTMYPAAEWVDGALLLRSETASAIIAALIAKGWRVA